MKSIMIVSRHFVLALMLFMQNSYAAESYFPQPVDFYQTADEARNKNIPIVILISSIYCDYCKFIKREFLVPMLKSGDYKNKVIIRVVEDDISDEVIDFNGETIESGTFSERYKINFTPTVIFVDYKGNELTNRIIGLESEEYYGAFLDQAIDSALVRIALAGK